MKKIDNIEKVLQIADEGLLMGSPVCSTELLQSVIKTALEHYKTEPSILRNEIFQVTGELPKLVNPVRRIEGEPSLLEWIEIRREMKPVLLSRFVGHWPAMAKWNLRYLWSVLRGRTVPVEEGSKYTDVDWGQRLVPFNDFIQSLQADPNASTVKQYLAQHPLLEQVPSLQDDIIIPDYCFTDSSDEPELNAWIGPAGRAQQV